MASRINRSIALEKIHCPQIMPESLPAPASWRRLIGMRLCYNGGVHWASTALPSRKPFKDGRRQHGTRPTASSSSLETQMAFEFELVATNGNARAGILHTPHGAIPTPVFAPVGTAATVKAVPPRDLEELEIKLVLANTYHLHLRPGDEIVRDLGGLHQFMGWSGPLLTDSGGFQVFSLGEINRIDDNGVTFRSHLDGSAMRLTPGRAMEIQQNLGADIIMAFDQCPSPNDRDEVKAANERTHRWLRRCREAHPDDNRQALFGIVQGGVFPDLRRDSARIVTDMDLKGYAIGGLAVGESKPEMYHTLGRDNSLLAARPTALPDGRWASPMIWSRVSAAA